MSRCVREQQLSNIAPFPKKRPRPTVFPQNDLEAPRHCCKTVFDSHLCSLGDSCVRSAPLILASSKCQVRSSSGHDKSSSVLRLRNLVCLSCSLGHFPLLQQQLPSHQRLPRPPLILTRRPPTQCQTQTRPHPRIELRTIWPCPFLSQPFPASVFPVNQLNPSSTL